MNCGFCGKKLGKKYSIISSQPKGGVGIKKICKDCEHFFMIINDDLKISGFKIFDHISIFCITYDSVRLYIKKMEQK